MAEDIGLKARLAEALARKLPALRGPLEGAYEKRFRANPAANLFRGRFDSYEAARASAPSHRPLGYDNDAAAALYRSRLERIYPADYPILHWLGVLLRERDVRSVLDVGGHIGIGYYAYARYLRFPPQLRWTVLDVPAVVRAGRDWADAHDPARALQFTTDWSEARGVDLLFASGALQYLEKGLGDILAQIDPAQRPRHLLLNLVPLHARESFYTLQSIGAAFCPYRIESEPVLRASLAAAGYEIRDVWENPEKSCWIPFEPTLSLDRYHGLYCERRASAS